VHALTVEQENNDSYNDNILDGEFVISAGVMEVILSKRNNECTRAMIDSGANVNISSPELSKILRLEIMPHNDKRSIGTAKQGGVLRIIGWIFPTGFTGPIAIVEGAAFTLLSTAHLQRNSMGVNFPFDEKICILYTKYNVFLRLEMNEEDQLYFVDIRKLMSDYQPEYVQQ
jgi:hypothetical protein